MDITTGNPARQSVQPRSSVPPIYSRPLRWLNRLAMALAGMFFFVLALQLLKQGAREYGHSIVQWLNIASGSDALGFGWLLSYGFLSGSPVAAIGVTLFASETINAWQTFTMVTGSRLGASFVVLLVGFAYALRGHRRDTSIATGILALLTTAAIYLPALLPGYWLLTSDVFAVWQFGSTSASMLTSWLDTVYTPLIQQLDHWLPGWALLLCGLLALPGGFSLIDRALPDIDPEHASSLPLERLISHPLALLLLGAAMTSVTLSVAVSISLIVPLSIKGIIQPRHCLPYIMGANIATFIDTLTVAYIIGGAAAFTIVLVEIISVVLVSLCVFLFCYHQFAQVILYAQERIIQSKTMLMLFLGTMFITPLLLLLI